jgi:hypothetical protein
MTENPTDHLDNARQALSAERDRSLREINAFEAFLDRVENLNTNTPTDAQPTERLESFSLRDDSACTQSGEVWSAYCERVLDIPHFETEYRETPKEHLQAELGDDVAALITKNMTLTEYHKRIITSRVEFSIARRKEQLETVEEEVDMVDQAEQLIEKSSTMLDDRDIDTIIEMPIRQIEEAKIQFEDLIDRCDQLLNDRQRMLDSRPEAKRLNREATAGYMYRDLDVTYPVIVALTKLRDRLGTRLMELEALMASQ